MLRGAVRLRLMRQAQLNTAECVIGSFRVQSASSSSAGVKGDAGAAGQRRVEGALAAPLPLLMRQMSVRPKELLLSEVGLDPNQNPPP